MLKKYKKYIIFVVIVLLLAIAYGVLVNSDFNKILQNSNSLKDYIIALGSFGPFLIIGLMTVAIIMSPIPSAPIALASGAIYGHTWGTLYVLIGSTIGAITAFLVARLIGYDVLQRWFGGRLAASWVGSQNSLMGIVFFSRLMPFISFDIVSYAAGLTTLAFWRFAIATIAGIAPASFLLAHFGDELSSTESQRIALAVIILGIVAALPFIIRLINKR